MKILVAGYQHETNTFAPTLADWAAFNRGDAFPAYMRGAAMLEQLRGVNIPIGGFIDAAARKGWQLVPSAWAGAIPSSFVTEDAFERICAALMDDVRQGGFDAVYLDLHGAAVASTQPIARASCSAASARPWVRTCPSSPASICTPT